MDEESSSEIQNNLEEKYEVKDIDDKYEIPINNKYDEEIPNKNEPLETKKKFKFIFMIYILLFTFILFIIFLIIFIVVLFQYKENYKYEENYYLKSSISNHNNSRIEFNNGLEIVLTQVNTDDNAGGAISFETGYLDNKYEPGLLKLAILSLGRNERTFREYLNDYLGNLNKVSEEFYSSIYFTILNSGFQHYLKNFSIYTYFDKDIYTSEHLNRTYTIFSNITSNIYNNYNEREKHIIEFLVYNITDKNGNDIWGQIIEKDLLNKLNKTNEDILNILKNLFNPKKIKMTFSSHYKMSLMKKIVLKYIGKLINNNDNFENIKEKEEKEYINLNTNKIIYYQIEKSQSNYIRINYYVNNNVNLNQLHIDSGYFNYIKYILDETHENSLYYKLTHPEKGKELNIKSLSCDFEIVLKRYIRFSILIKLNEYSYKYIKDIIEIVYNYIEKIKSHINNIKLKDNRVEELYKIIEQNFTFMEDIHTGEYHKNKAKDLFYRDERDYFLKEVWVPSDFNKNYTKLKCYINQLKIENSVVIVGINQYTINRYNLNNNSNELSFIFNNIQTTKSDININYTIHNLSEIKLNINSDKSFILSNHSNKYISKYTKDTIISKGENIPINYKMLELRNVSNNLVQFYWCKDTHFGIPKVYVNLYIFHPFIRPNHTESTSDTDNLFFYSMIYISYLEREINLVLSDAIRAGNTFKLNYTENFFFIDIFAYSDQIENILEIIKEKIISKKEDIINNTNFAVYRDYALEELLNFKDVDIREKLKLKYFKFLTEKNRNFSPIYNYYNFPKINFEEMVINQTNNYLEFLNAPIIRGFILGYYEKEDAQKIFDSFSKNFPDNIRPTLEQANFIDFSKVNTTNYVQLSLRKPIRDETKIENNITEIINNRTYSFIRFANYTYDSRIAVEILKKIFQQRGIIIDSINQKTIYLRLSFRKNDRLNDTSQVKKEIINQIDITERDYTKQVDVIGDRYYYLVKNEENENSKNPYSMKDNAIGKSYAQLYEFFTEFEYKIDRNNYKSFKKIIEIIFNKNKDYYELSGGGTN